MKKLVPISSYNYFFMIEIIRTARSIIPATHLRKIGISVPPYEFILKGEHKYRHAASQNTLNRWRYESFWKECAPVLGRPLYIKWSSELKIRWHKNLLPRGPSSLIYRKFALRNNFSKHYLIYWRISSVIFVCPPFHYSAVVCYRL